MVAKLKFPSVFLLIFGACSLLHIPEASRLAPTLAGQFIALKVFYGITACLLAWSFYQKPWTDLKITLTFLLGASYPIVFMWYAPLYEVAYFQIAIGCSFFYPKRRWPYPLTFGAGLVGLTASKYFQLEMDWKIPEPLALDFYWSALVFFMLGWIIHRYAVVNQKKEQERLSKYSQIGVTTTRVIHDIKGLLSSPLLLIEALKSGQNHLSNEDLARQLEFLESDLSKVRDVIKSMNSLVQPSTQAKDISLVETIESARVALDRRLSHVQIELPVDRRLWSCDIRLKSVFFNLFLNSIEAFELNQVMSSDPHVESTKKNIQIFWQGNHLIYEDNAGSTSMAKKHGGGIGLELITMDLDSLGTRHRSKITNSGFRMELDFS